MKLQRELTAKEEELVKARFLITQLTESERTRNKVIDEYYKEVTDLKRL